MAENQPNIPEGYELGEDGCICPAKPKKPVCKKGLTTCPPNPRFPNQDQTYHCYRSFVDFQKCARLLGDYPGCAQFYRCYMALCPKSWYTRWYEQMQNGTFPRRIYPPSPIVIPDPDAMKNVCPEEEEEVEMDVC